MPRKLPSNDTSVSDPSSPEVQIEDSRESPETKPNAPVTVTVLETGVKIEDF